MVASVQEKENTVENGGNNEMSKQEEISQQKNMTIVSEKRKDNLEVLSEEKDVTKLDQHKGEDAQLLQQKEHEGDTQLLEQKEKAAQEQMEQITSENNKPLVETGTLEKTPSKPLLPHRASANMPISKKPATQKQLTLYASPPKHVSPKSMANLQSEFQQAGYEIEDGYDSEGDLNTFSELPRDEAECISTTSLDDSLLGSESFISLDNYNKEVGNQKPKGSRVGSAKERDRKYSQENETQLKEQKTSQDSEAQLKEPQVTTTSVGPASLSQGEMFQKPVANLAAEISQASETNQSNAANEASSASSTDFDTTKDKGTVVSHDLVDTTAAKKSNVTKQKPLSMTTAVDDDSSSDSDSSDEDVIIAKGD